MSGDAPGSARQHDRPVIEAGLGIAQREGRFIAQVMRGKLDVREIDDIDAALSYNEVKALATGNP